MSPTTFFLLALTTLISQAFSLLLPGTPTSGLINIVGADAGNNPLPPPPPGWYHIPDTTLSINLPSPPSHPIPLPSALACLTAAQNSLSATIAARGSTALLPRAGWSFTNSHVQISARPIFTSLGTYGQLSAAMTGLKYLITEPEGEGAGWLRWVLADEVQGVVMEGGMGAVGSLVGMGTGTGTGTVLGGGVSAVGSAVGSGSGSVSAATATQSVSIVGVEELDSL